MVTHMLEIFEIVAHLLATVVRVAVPGGVRAVIVESLLLKHQLLILNRSRKRAPRLTPWDRLLFGVGAFLVSPKRLPKIAIGIRPSTLLRFHRALVQRKYRLLIAHAFDIQIDKDVVRRILARYFRSPSGTKGPSWLTLIGDLTDSL